MPPPEHHSRPPRFAHAVAVLFGAHAAGLLVPLLTVPWLARTLSPAGWAPVLVAQALAAWAILVLEFGFDLAGTRDVAQAASGASLARTAAAVQRARFMLAPLVAAGVVGAAKLLGHEPRLIAGTVGYVVARGLSPYWFFQGTRRIRFATFIETSGKLVPAAAVFALVRGTGDGWRVLALQAVGSTVATALLTWRMHRQHVLPAVTTREALAAMRAAAPMFGARAASGLYGHANLLILSAAAPVATVAAFGGAERIVRAALNLMIPLNQAIFPRISLLARESPPRAMAEIRRTLAVFVGLALCGAFVIALFGNTVVGVLLGPRYASSVPVLRLLVLVIPMVAAGTVLGIYWALPWRRERLFLVAVLLGGSVNLLLAALLVPRHGAMGMTVAVVSAESSVTTLLAVAFLRRAP